MVFIMIYDNERWVELKYKGVRSNMYLISDHGRVKNINTNKIIKQQVSETGYMMVGLMKIDGKRNKTIKVHRLVGSHFIENFDPDKQINHIDGIKENNYYKNLECVSISYNIIHSYQLKLNTPRRGSLNGMNKYSISTIEFICKCLSEGKRGSEIKHTLNNQRIYVTRYLISDIKHKKSWVHVSDKYF